MDDPEKLTTPGTQYTGRKQNRTQKTQKMSNTDPTKNGGELRRPRRASSSCLCYDTHYVTHTVNICLTPLYTNMHKNTIRHEPSYKQLEIKTNRTSFVCRNRNGHHTRVYYLFVSKIYKRAYFSLSKFLGSATVATTLNASFNWMSRFHSTTLSKRHIW